MKKIIAAILVVLMAAFPAACANQTGGGDTTLPETTSPTAAGDTSRAATDEVTTGPDEADELGNLKFDGAPFYILSRKSTSYEIKSEEVSGNLVSDAVFERNAEIEERFGVKINIIELDGDWGARDGFMAAVSNSVLSGSKDYDLVMTHSAYIVNIAVNGNGYDMANLEQIDFSKKWWCYEYVDNASLYGRYYTAMGDIGYTLYQYMMCVFFNKSIAANVDLPDLYALVKDGEWTFEKLRQFALLVGDDLNGDNKRNELDRFGYGANNHTCRMTATFWDAGMTVLGQDGKRQINLPNEKYLNIYDRLYDFVYNNSENVFYIPEGSTVETNMFMNDQLLFFSERLGNVEKMKEMKSEYGILPFPKYDSYQESYISSARDALTAILVCNGIGNPEMVGTITEALCMIGYRKITPAYYETSLKLKYLSDPVAMEMLDLIRDTMTFEFASTYTNSISLIYSTLGDNMNNKVPSIASIVKANSKIWQKNIDKLYEDFAKLS